MDGTFSQKDNGTRRQPGWRATRGLIRWGAALLLLSGPPLALMAVTSLLVVGRGPADAQGAAGWPLVGTMLGAIALASGVTVRGMIGAAHERLAAVTYCLAVALLARGLDLWALSCPSRLQSAIAGTASSTWLYFPVTALLASWGCLALGWLTYCAVLDACDSISNTKTRGFQAIAGLAFTAQVGLWLWALLGYVSGSPVLLPATG